MLRYHKSRCKVPSARSWVQLMCFFLTLCFCLSLIHGNIVALIHNGIDAKPGQWPWHATLLIGNGLCGGSFINNNTVLTAAHCAVTSESVIRESDIRVYGGRKYRDASTRVQQELPVAKIAIHPEYNSSTFANDIAILKLATDINITNFVRPVAIWNMENDQNHNNESIGTVIGFGLDKEDEESDTLQQATLPVLDAPKCLEYDPETYRIYLTGNMFCAGGKDNVSACNGDSGGGMFSNIGETWFLRGIVSFSPLRANTSLPLCDSSKPTVFTDVKKYNKWILRYTNMTMWLKSLKPCKDRSIGKDTECNAATRFDYDFLIAREFKNIVRVPMNGDPEFIIHENESHVEDPTELDYDCAEGRFYWTEHSNRTIFSAMYDGTDKKPFITDDIKAGNIAVDWISRRLYWVDMAKETIEVASLDNPKVRTTVRTNIVDNVNIAVDPLGGKLYRTGGQYGIESYNLDGSEPERILGDPNTAIIQHSLDTGELCYIRKIDDSTSNIECIDTRTKQVRTIVSDLDHPWKLFGDTSAETLTITDERFYWTVEDSDIESIDNYGVRQNSIRYNQSSYVWALKAVTNMCPIIYSPCADNNGNCPANTICLLKSRSLTGKICKSFKSQNYEQSDTSTPITNKPTKPFIQDGKEAKQLKWPWNVAVYSPLQLNTGYLCGGTIINRNTILTATHCFYYDTTKGYRIIRENEIIVRAGSKYIDGITEVTQEANVAQIVIHPKYNHTNQAHDIAILKLSTDLDITSFVRPVSIWSMDSDPNQNEGTYGTVIGFGLDEDGEPSDTLQETSLTVLDTETCLEYDKTKFGARSTGNIYCGVGRHNGSGCSVGNGGGMFFNFNGTWYLGGIVSFSPTRLNVTSTACSNSNPTLLTNVSKYSKWILRYSDRVKWLKDLEPCEDDMIGKDTECNAANRFEHEFLLTRASHTVTRVPLNGDPPSKVGEDDHPEDYFGIDYNCAEGRFYWTNRNEIVSAKYDGTDKKTVITKDLYPGAVAVDWISRRLYWVDVDKVTIEVASLDDPDLRTTLLTNILYSTKIIVDPLRGKLYKMRLFKDIVSYNLDGSVPERLVEADWFSDMKVNRTTGELCYFGKDYPTMECIDTWTKHIRTIVSNLTNAVAFALTDDMLYWSEANSDVIKSIDNYGVHQTTSQLRTHTGLDYTVINEVDNVCPLFHSPCANNNGVCPIDTICLVNPHEPSGKICKCTKSYLKNC